jgi:hypothetical protein
MNWLDNYRAETEQMSIETRLSKLEAISSPDGPVIFFWAMTKDCRRMTSQEIDSGIAALNAPENARVMSVSWLPRDVRTKANEYRKPTI